jgi:hypothetical protein
MRSAVPIKTLAATRVTNQGDQPNSRMTNQVMVGANLVFALVVAL